MGTQGCSEEYFLTQNTQMKLYSPEGGVGLGRPKWLSLRLHGRKQGSGPENYCTPEMARILKSSTVQTQQEA